MWMIAAALICTIPFSQQSAPKPSCIIASRHQHKFGENMSRLSPHKGLDYVEGEYPQGIKFHSELSDKLVQQIQERGGHIVILKADYSHAELDDARKQCLTFQSVTPVPSPTPSPSPSPKQ